MERIQTSTVTRQFKRTFGEATLNELGRISRFCRRERDVTPFRLALSLIESFASGSANCIADIQRAFNALCETTVCYKPFHNQLAKRQFLAERAVHCEACCRTLGRRPALQPLAPQMRRTSRNCLL